MDLKGKRVCVKDVMFPLLPRMIGGMFYNTYVVRFSHDIYSVGYTSNNDSMKNNKYGTKIS